MAQPLLSELAGVDDRDQLIEDMQEQIDQLKRDLLNKSRELRLAQQQAGKSIEHLRAVLTPLYRGLQEVFGEMEAVAPGNGNGSVASSDIDPRQRAIWDSWKKKIGGKAADAIEALLLHGEMTPQGVAVAISIHPNNVAKVMYKLNQAGILRKNGRNYALKTE